MHTRVCIYVSNHPHLLRLSTKLAWYANEVIPFGCEFSIIHIMFAYNGQKHTLSQRNYIKFVKHGTPYRSISYSNVFTWSSFFWGSMQTKLQISRRPFTFQSLKIYTMRVCMCFCLWLCVCKTIER